MSESKKGLLRWLTKCEKTSSDKGMVGWLIKKKIAKTKFTANSLLVLVSIFFFVVSSLMLVNV